MKNKISYEIHDTCGFITDHEFFKILKETNYLNELVIILCTKEINGDIAVDKNHIPKFKKKIKKLVARLKKTIEK